VDAIVTTAGDTLKCVADNTTITGDAGKSITINGDSLFNASSGNEITITTYLSYGLVSGTHDYQYVDFIGSASHGIQIYGGALTQFDNVNSTSVNGAGIRNQVALTYLLTNCTFSGSGVGWANQDIVCYQASSLILDTVTYSTISFRTTSGWIVSKRRQWCS